MGKFGIVLSLHLMNTEFNYENYDRQLGTLINMSHLLVNAWDDYGTTEMTLDIKSLNFKASRLCYMTDTDWSLQQQDMMHLRKSRNEEWLAQLEFLVKESICPLLQHIVQQIRSTNQMEGKKWASFPSNLSEVMPRLSEMLMHEGMQPDKWNEILTTTQQLETQLKKTVRIVSFPGMDYRQRFWLFYKYFALMCYLLYHFQRVNTLCNSDLSKEEAGLRLQQFIQYYAESPIGSQELQRYYTVLKFNNDGMEPDLEHLKDARKKLLEGVPTSTQLYFMNHVEDLQQLAEDLRQANVPQHDFMQLVDVLAKWQLLTQQIEALKLPQKAQPAIYNEVFHTMVHNRRVNLVDLRIRIERMLPLIKRKNLWFCVWCVLRHQNLLSTDNFEAFARQMLHKDWFGKTSRVLGFNGDTLREYSGYFTELHYPAWNEKQYQIYRVSHQKKKWSESLCDKFLRTCLAMEEILTG